MNQLFNKSVGQSLIEVAVLVGAIVLLVSGLILVAFSGLRNSQYSKNQVQATKLAQEGIDLVKIAKDQNCRINYAGADYYWYTPTGVSSPNYIWNNVVFAPSNNILFRVVPPGGGACLTQITAGDPLGGTNPQNQFLRTIKVFNDGANTQKIVSEVSWIDVSGTHKSNIVTILAK